MLPGMSHFASRWTFGPLRMPLNHPVPQGLWAFFYETRLLIGRASRLSWGDELVASECLAGLHAKFVAVFCKVRSTVTEGGDSQQKRLLDGKRVSLSQ